MANVDFGKGDVYGINFNRIEGDTIGESVNEMNVGHAEVMRLERILSSKNKKALVKALDDGTIKTSKDLAKWVKTIKESVNEGLSNYSLLDFFKEMQSFPAAGVDAKDIKGASQPHNKKKTVKNTPALQSLLDEWKSGRYDEDPGTLVDELRHLLKTDTKDVRAGFSSSDINNLDDVADDVSDVFSNKGTLKMHIPYQKWVKMDDDEKAWNVEQALYKLTKSNAVKKLLSKKEDDVIAYVVKVLSESVNEASVKFNNIKTFNESVNEAKKYDWDDILDVLMQSTAVGGAGKVIDRINAKDPEVKELLAGRYKSFPDFAKAVQSIYNLEESINEGTVKISGTLRFFDQFLTDMANIGMYDGDFEEDVKRGYTEYSEDVWDNIKTKNAVARLVHKYHAEITESVNEAEIGGYYLMKQLKDMSDDMKRDEPKAAAALMYLYDRINQSARDIDLNADDIDDFLREPRGRKHSLNLPDWMIHDLFVESFILQEDGATNMPQADPPIPLTPEQKKKKKEEEDEEAEEMAANDAADGAGPPKQGGFAKAAAKQMQSYMEKIDSFDGFVNEGEILVWDELEKPFADLKNALDKITKENTDPKWSKALLSIWKQIEKAEHNLGVYDRNLGVITTESADVTSIAYALKNKGKVRPNDETIKFHIDSYKVDDDPYDVAKEIGDYYNWTEREIEKAEKIIRKKYLR